MNIDANVLKYMSLDRLRQRIVIQKPAITRDEEGNQVTAYTDEQTVWAAVEALTAASSWDAAEREWEITYRVILRYGIAVVQTDRIQYRGRWLRITSPPVDAGGRHQWTILECREWVEA